MKNNESDYIAENEKIYAECGKLEEKIAAAKKEDDVIRENELLKQRRDLLTQSLGELKPPAGESESSSSHNTDDRTTLTERCVQANGVKPPTPSTTPTPDSLTERCRKARAGEQNK